MPAPPAWRPTSPAGSIESWPLADRIGFRLAWAAGVSLCLVAGSIVVYMAVQGLQYLDLGLLFESPEADLDQSKSGGYLDPLVGTVVLTILGTLLAVPLGVATAIWLSEYARPAWLARAVESGVEVVAGTGHWYKAGNGLVPIRWVFVHDLQGTHRDEYFYSTDPALTADQIVSLYTGRWSIEVTFQEVRAHLGFATPRNRSAKSVLRTAPCLLGLFSVVSLIFARHARGKGFKVPCSPWHSRTEATFSDAIATVRRLCWEPVLKRSPNHAGVIKLPSRLRLTLLDHLSRAG